MQIVNRKDWTPLTSFRIIGTKLRAEIFLDRLPAVPVLVERLRVVAAEEVGQRLLAAARLLLVVPAPVERRPEEVGLPRVEAAARQEHPQLLQRHSKLVQVHHLCPQLTP